MAKKHSGKTCVTCIAPMHNLTVGEVAVQQGAPPTRCSTCGLKHSSKSTSNACKHNTMSLACHSYNLYKVHSRGVLSCIKTAPIIAHEADLPPTPSHRWQLPPNLNKRPKAERQACHMIGLAAQIR